MREVGSITILLQNLNDGAAQAIAELHHRCIRWIEKTARRRLRGHSLRFVDEEDIAQDAFLGFVLSVREGRVPKLNTRHDLFALLTHIVARKTATQFERAFAAKRGGGRVWSEAELDASADDERNQGGLQAVSAQSPTPAEEAAIADEYRHYLEALPDALRLVAELHIAGLTNREIAVQLGCVDRTIERKLALIRVRWQETASREFGT